MVCSRWYSSAPIPAGDAPRYVNGVIRFDGAPDPVALLAALQGIEQEHGRTRTTPNAPRTLDLDIVDLNGTVRATPDPILPHPRAHHRAFVLLPLRDVAPHWTHPALRLPLPALLADLPLQDTHPI